MRFLDFELLSILYFTLLISDLKLGRLAVKQRIWLLLMGEGVGLQIRSWETTYNCSNGIFFIYSATKNKKMGSVLKRIYEFVSFFCAILSF